MYKKTFTSSVPGPPLHVNLMPAVPQIEIRIGDSGPSFTLIGEDFGCFVAWIKEQGYHG